MQPTAGGTSASHMMAHDGTSATYASTAAVSRQEACLLPTLTYPRSPSCWHICQILDHPSLPPDLGSWDHLIQSCAWDVHGSHWDTLCGWEWHKDGGWEWHEARKSKQRLAPTKNIWARTCHMTMLHGTVRIFIYSYLLLNSILY